MGDNNINKLRIFALLFLSILLGCKSDTKKIEPYSMPKIEHIDYAGIDNQIQEILQKNNGNFPVMVYEKYKGTKHILYIGERHGNDPNDKRFDTIQKYFSQLKPTIILNEGGQVADSIHSKTREEAIIKNGTIGYLKFLADQSNLKLVNADCPDSVQIAGLLRLHERKAILYFLVVQRFIPRFISGHHNLSDLNYEYDKFMNTYIKSRCKLVFSDPESKWSFFEDLYEQNNEHKKIDLENFDLSQTENDKGEFGDILRHSDQIRDSAILNNIFKNLQTHDRVFIVFGAKHLLAQRPTLNNFFTSNGN